MRLHTDLHTDAAPKNIPRTPAQGIRGWVRYSWTLLCTKKLKHAIGRRPYVVPQLWRMLFVVLEKLTFGMYNSST